MANESRVLTLLPSHDDHVLVAAAAGDRSALRELLRRHAPLSWRLAHAVAGDDAMATEALIRGFRQALASCARGGPGEGATPSLLLAGTRQAALRAAFDRRTDGPAGDVVAEAFRSLPECWRSVLVLTRAGGLTAVEAAEPMGLPPDDTGQLATRAAAGFGERYLQLVSPRARGSCRSVIGRLEPFLRGELPPHQTARLDQHLAGCPSCGGRLTWLRRLGAAVDRLVPAPPAELAVTAFDALAAAPRPSTRPMVVIRRVAAVAAAALLVVGLAGLGQGRADQGSPLATPNPPSQTAGVGGDGWSTLDIPDGTVVAVPAVSRRNVSRSRADRAEAGYAASSTETLAAPGDDDAPVVGTPDGGDFDPGSAVVSAPSSVAPGVPDDPEPPSPPDPTPPPDDDLLEVAAGPVSATVESLEEPGATATVTPPVPNADPVTLTVEV